MPRWKPVETAMVEGTADMSKRTKTILIGVAVWLIVDAAMTYAMMALVWRGFFIWG